MSRLSLLVLTLCLLGVPVARSADPEKATPVLSAGTEEKLRKVVDKLAKDREEKWRKELEEITDKLLEKTADREEAKKTLQAAATRAIAECLGPWRKGMEEALRRWPRLAGATEEAISSMLERMLQGGSLPRALHPVGAGQLMAPAGHAEWQAAIARVLPPAELAAWQKAQAEEAAKFQEQLAAILRRSTEYHRRYASSAIKNRLTELIVGLPAVPERKEALEALAKTTVEKALEAWAADVTETLRQSTEAEREGWRKRNQFYQISEGLTEPWRQPVWEEGVARLVTPAEMQALEEERKLRSVRRLQVFGTLALMFLDERVGLLEAQRQQLRPLVEVAITKVEGLRGVEKTNERFTPSVQDLLRAGAQVQEAELKKILDEAQLACWQKASHPPPSRQEQMTAAATKKPKAVEPPPAVPGAVWQPEDYEQALSDFLATQTAAIREKIHPLMETRAEEAIRVAAPSGEVAARLRLAARGSAEQWLSQWRIWQEQNLRARLQDTNPRNIRQRLASLEENSYEQRFQIPEPAPLWGLTLERELTPEQVQKIKAERRARTQFSDRVIASVILSFLDQHYMLSKAQWEALEPKLANSVAEAAGAIDSIYSFSEDRVWFLQEYSMYFPLGGLADELPKILRTEQWEQLKGSNEFSNAKELWTNIRPGRRGIRVE